MLTKKDILKARNSLLWKGSVRGTAKLLGVHPHVIWNQLSARDRTHWKAWLATEREIHKVEMAVKQILASYYSTGQVPRSNDLNVDAGIRMKYGYNNLIRCAGLKPRKVSDVNFRLLKAGRQPYVLRMVCSRSAKRSTLLSKALRKQRELSSVLSPRLTSVE